MTSSTAPERNTLEERAEGRARKLNSFRFETGAQVLMRRPDLFSARVTIPLLRGEVLTQIEQLHRAMVCDECLTMDKSTMAANFGFLFLDYQEDPLKNFWKLAQLSCLHCGHNEMHAVLAPDQRTPPRAYEPTDVFEQFEMQKKAQAEHLSMQQRMHAMQAQQAAYQNQLGVMSQQMMQEIDKDILSAVGMGQGLLSSIGQEGIVPKSFLGKLRFKK